MTTVKEQIENLFNRNSSQQIVNIEKLPKSGGDRIYFRLNTQEQSFIAAYNLNVKENETFLYFSDHFKKINAPVPSIFMVNDEQTIYIQEDFGGDCLLDILEAQGENENARKLYEKSLKALAYLQIKGDENLQYKKCITSKEFGKQAILSDLLYFKYYFLDTLKLPYDKEKLGDDFEALSSYLNHADHKYFMFRDFQSRNIMVHNGEPFFIDYQGGMKGALQYDVASLLWQAKADLSDDWKNELYNII